MACNSCNSNGIWFPDFVSNACCNPCCSGSVGGTNTGCGCGSVGGTSTGCGCGSVGGTSTGCGCGCGCNSCGCRN